MARAGRDGVGVQLEEPVEIATGRERSPCTRENGQLDSVVAFDVGEQGLEFAVDVAVDRIERVRTFERHPDDWAVELNGERLVSGEVHEHASNVGSRPESVNFLTIFGRQPYAAQVSVATPSAESFPPMSGRVGLVTGAGQGLGRAIAHRLASAGAVVVVNDIDESRVAATVSAIAAAGGTAVAAPGDIAVEADVERCVLAAEAEHGPVNFACNNAIPAVRLQPVDQLDLAYAQQLVAVAMLGTALCIKHEVRAMRRGCGGAIVNISSTAHIRGQAGATLYAGCKAGIEAMTRVAANEAGPDGIRVNAVQAGGMLTPALLEAMSGSPTIKEHMEAAVPLRYVAEPEEVADVVLFLVSDLSRYMTGSVVTADGGGLLHPSRLPITTDAS